MADIEKTPSPAAPPDPKSGGTIKVHRGIKVHLDARLPALDAGSGYAVEATDGGDRRLYAIVCDPGVPYRHKPMAVLRSKNHKNYVSVVTAARVSPAGSGEERFAIVLNRPAGVTLAKLLGNGEGLGERWIAETVLPQALTALSELHGLGVTHRALCLNNVFYDADQGTLILGQCVTSPAGSLQPAAFEPLESAAAMAYGRGAGTPAFDTFALGVLLLSLSAGAAPASSDDDRAQLVSRQVESSFAALSGSHKLRGPFADLIRGLMCDSEVQRWGLEEIDAWVHGRRPPANRVIASRRALRPFSFEERDYRYDLELALEFDREPAKAAAIIGEGAFDDWLRTGLRDSSAADDLAARLVNAAASTAEVRTTEAVLALDPFGPLRSGAIAVTPDGFGPVLAAAFASEDRTRRRNVVALLASDVPEEWMRLRRARAARNPGVTANLSNIQKKHLKSKGRPTFSIATSPPLPPRVLPSPNRCFRDWRPRILRRTRGLLRSNSLPKCNRASTAAR
jgi:hypothetical protein